MNKSKKKKFRFGKYLNTTVYLAARIIFLTDLMKWLAISKFGVFKNIKFSAENSRQR